MVRCGGGTSIRLASFGGVVPAYRASCDINGQRSHSTPLRSSSITTEQIPLPASQGYRALRA